MAPPYIRITPQLTYSSMACQLTTLKTKRAPTARMAMLARPKRLPRKTQPKRVRSMMTATIFSL